MQDQIKNKNGILPHDAKGDAPQRGRVVALRTVEGDPGGTVGFTEVEVGAPRRGGG